MSLFVVVVVSHVQRIGWQPEHGGALMIIPIVVYLRYSASPGNSLSNVHTHCTAFVSYDNSLTYCTVHARPPTRSFLHRLSHIFCLRIREIGTSHIIHSFLFIFHTAARLYFLVGCTPLKPFPYLFLTGFLHGPIFTDVRAQAFPFRHEFRTPARQSWSPNLYRVHKSQEQTCYIAPHQTRNE